MNSVLLHALDLAAVRDWEGAKRSLEGVHDSLAERLLAFVTELDRRDHLRRRNSQRMRHEVGNALAIVQANLEGVIDGVFDATPERLAGMHAALAAASEVLESMGREPGDEPSGAAPMPPYDVRAVAGAQIGAIEGMARAKDVSLVYDDRGAADEAGAVRGDAAATARLVRDAVVETVRFTPPGGRIEIALARDPLRLRLRACDAAGAAVTAVGAGGALEIRLPVTS